MTAPDPRYVHLTDQAIASGRTLAEAGAAFYQSAYKKLTEDGSSHTVALQVASELARAYVQSVVLSATSKEPPR